MKIIHFYTAISFIFLFFLSSPFLFATVTPIPLDNRVQESDDVIMAKAISSVSYWNADSTNIYTSYTMEVTAYLKNPTTVSFFQCIVPGGEVGQDLEIVTPNVHISIGEEYVMMLQPAPITLQNPNQRGRALNNSIFAPYAHVQGVMVYKDENYYDFLDQQPMDEETMMAKVKKITGIDAVKPNGEIYEPRTKIKDKDGDGICSLLDCDDNDANFPLPVGALCDDGILATKNDRILEDGCTCAGNPGQPLDCDKVTIDVSGHIVRINNLLAKSERIEIIGSETNGQSQVICDGDCDETHYIEGLLAGNKLIRIWMIDEQEFYCFREYTVEITELLCEDTEMLDKLTLYFSQVQLK